MTSGLSGLVFELLSTIESSYTLLGGWVMFVSSTTMRARKGTYSQIWCLRPNIRCCVSYGCEVKFSFLCEKGKEQNPYFPLHQESSYVISPWLSAMVGCDVTILHTRSKARNVISILRLRAPHMQQSSPFFRNLGTFGDIIDQSSHLEALSCFTWVTSNIHGLFCDSSLGSKFVIQYSGFCSYWSVSQGLACSKTTSI
jgi:hypothetical protein